MTRNIAQEIHDVFLSDNGAVDHTVTEINSKFLTLSEESQAWILALSPEELESVATGNVDEDPPGNFLYLHDCVLKPCPTEVWKFLEWVFEGDEQFGKREYD